MDIFVYKKISDFFLKGIGGFMVRQRSRPGQGPGKAKRSLCRKDSSGSVSENPIGKDEGLYTNNVSKHLHYSGLSPELSVFLISTA